MLIGCITFLYKQEGCKPPNGYILKLTEKSFTRSFKRSDCTRKKTDGRAQGAGRLYVSGLHTELDGLRGQQQVDGHGCAGPWMLELVVSIILEQQYRSVD